VGYRQPEKGGTSLKVETKHGCKRKKSGKQREEATPIQRRKGACLKKRRWEFSHHLKLLQGGEIKKK